MYDEEDDGDNDEDDDDNDDDDDNLEAFEKTASGSPQLFSPYWKKRFALEKAFRFRKNSIWQKTRARVLL